MSPPGHSNLVSLVAHNFTKLALLKAYLRIQRFEVLYFNILICIFETYPSSSFTENDGSLRIPGHDSLKIGHFSREEALRIPNLIRKSIDEFTRERAFSILISLRWYLFVMQPLRMNEHI